jgi:imidazolonepropionase-like amidohydrolase
MHPEATNKERTILTDLRIWDGEHRLEADTVVLTGRRIEALCDKTALSSAESRMARSMAGMTALPGLMDAHVHMVLDPNRSSPPGADETPDPAAMRERAAMMVRAGITTARDLGGGAWLEVELRNAIERGESLGPRLLCSGQPVTCTGGHCHFWGGEAANAAAAKVVIDRQVAHQVDLVKVMATGGRFTRGSKPGAPQFELPVLSEIVDYARDKGLNVAAHCHGTPGIDAAVRAGVHSIEHCSWVGDSGWASDYQVGVVEAMLERRTWVSPTINAGWQRMLDANNQTLTRMRAALVDMRAHGVPFMASTDAGIPGVFHHELPKALVVYGRVAELSNEQVLRAATSDAARGLGVEQQTGRLAAGFDADLLVVDGDPLQNIDALGRPVGVWARGVVVR